MVSFSDKNVIDVKYEEADEKNEYKETSDRVIRGEPLFYSTTQTADMVGVEPSTIRFWSKRFESLLDVEISNRNKQYKKSDIEKLKFIKKLAKDDGLTLQQIEDYCGSKGFDIDNIEKSVIDSTNPLAIQTFISAMTVELDKKLSDFSQELFEKVKEQQKQGFILQNEMNEKLQETIAVTVDELVSEKLETALTELKEHIMDKEQEQKKRDEELIDLMRAGMEERKRQNEQEKKGFWNRIFNK